MIDLKSLAAMRDEIENIQGGVGLSKDEHNQESFPDRQTDISSSGHIITDNMLSPDGPSLGEAARRAFETLAQE